MAEEMQKVDRKLQNGRRKRGINSSLNPFSAPFGFFAVKKSVFILSICGYSLLTMLFKCAAFQR